MANYKSKERKKLELEKRKCLGKIKHHSESMANETFMRMKNKKLLDVYKCEFCGKYHIGNNRYLNKEN